MGIFMFFQGFIKSGKNIFGCHLQVKQAAEFPSTSLPTASIPGGIETPWAVQLSWLSSVTPCEHDDVRLVEW
jgi:hypothetical protein